jgi:hypothetical protein
MAARENVSLLFGMMARRAGTGVVSRAFYF